MTNLGEIDYESDIEFLPNFSDEEDEIEIEAPKFIKNCELYSTPAAADVLVQGPLKYATETEVEVKDNDADAKKVDKGSEAVDDLGSPPLPAEANADFYNECQNQDELIQKIENTNMERDAAMAAIKNARWDEQAGKKRPAYGLFKCELCDREWDSWKAWRETGQRCGKCLSQNSYDPDEIKAILYFYCKPCNKLWRDTNLEPRFCQVCKKETAPSGDRVPKGYQKARFPRPAQKTEGSKSEEDSKIDRTTNISHKMDLCEFCNFLNKNIPDSDWVLCYEHRPEPETEPAENVPAVAAATNH